MLKIFRFSHVLGWTAQWNTRGLGCWLAEPRQLTKHTAKEIMTAKKNQKSVILFRGYSLILLFPFFYCKE